MKTTTNMIQSKTTLHMVVYAAEANQGRPGTPLIKTIYLTKSELPLPYPEHIMVTVEARQ